MGSPLVAINDWVGVTPVGPPPLWVPRSSAMSEQTVHNWKKLFFGAGRDGLAQGWRWRSVR